MLSFVNHINNESMNSKTYIINAYCPAVHLSSVGVPAVLLQVANLHVGKLCLFCAWGLLFHCYFVSIEIMGGWHCFRWPTRMVLPCSRALRKLINGYLFVATCRDIVFWHACRIVCACVLRRKRTDTAEEEAEDIDGKCRVVSNNGKVNMMNALIDQ